MTLAQKNGIFITSNILDMGSQLELTRSELLVLAIIEYYITNGVHSYTWIDDDHLAKIARVDYMLIPQILESLQSKGAIIIKYSSTKQRQISI